MAVLRGRAEGGRRRKGQRRRGTPLGTIIERLEQRSMLSANLPPVNTVPGPQTALINMPFAFTAYRGNGISVSDPDASSNQIRMTLSVNTGTLTLLNRDPGGGLTYSQGDGTEDASMQFVGTPANINTALSWISYQPAAGYTGSATFTVTTNDLGDVGVGGPQITTSTIPITVAAVPNYAPSPSYLTLPWVLDQTLNGTGMQSYSVTASVDSVHDFKVLSSGKIVAVGAVNDRFAILRFNADMTLDETFGNGGGTQTDFGAGVHAQKFTIDSQGRYVVVGRNRIARYTVAGALDTTFGTNGVTVIDHVGQAYDVAIQADAKLVVVGRDNSSYRVTRLSPNGSVESNWSYRHTSQNNVRSLILRDDGDILLIGRAYDWNQRVFHFNNVIRINSSGVQEQEFNVDMGTNAFVHSSLALPDGKFLLIGTADGELAVTRHQRSGEVDLNFGTNGIVRYPILNGQDDGYKATLATDGKILITGFSHNGVDNDITIIRMNQDGSLDTSFNMTGKVSVNLGNSFGYGIAELSNGRILVMGRTGDDIAMVRLLGTTDVSTAAANAAPVNSVPGTQQTLVDTSLAFTAYRGNQISISDVDAALNHLRVTVGVSSGTLTFLNPDPNGGLTYITGDGFEDASMSFTGTLGDINAALAWISYQPPVNEYFQWTVESGGNGNWYQVVYAAKTWEQAQADAVARGGYLATVTSAAENDYVNKLYSPSVAPWLGGFQDRTALNYSEPSGAWKWVTGEPWSYTNWNPGDPSNSGSGEHHLLGNFQGTKRFVDANGSSTAPYVVEYNSDPRPPAVRQATLTITTEDLTNFGSGGGKTDTDTVAININPVPNFAPSPSYLTLPWVLDQSFSADGKNVLSLTAGIDSVHDTRLLSSGKIVAVGATNDRFAIMRFNADLTIDASFGTNGFTSTDFGAGVHAQKFTIDSQGRYVVVGRNRIARYTAAGALDTTFGTNGVTVIDHVGQAYDVAIQADAKLVVVGRDNSSYRVTRLSSNGSVESNWSYRHTSQNNVRSLILRDDGDILLIGRAYDWNQRVFHFNNVIRINSSGVQEQEFNVDMGTNAFVHSSLALPDGKFLLIGTADGELAVTRHQRSGEVDLNFGTNGIVRYPILNGQDDGYKATLATDGKILITGFSHNGVDNDITIIRMNQDGSLDTSFNTTGIVAVGFGAHDYGYAVTSMPDGKIVVLGRSGNDIAQVRLLGDSDYLAGLNQAPTAVAVTSPITSLPENTSTATAIQVGVVSVTDDGLGTNTITLSGAHASSFEVVGGRLYLKQGVVLNYETRSSMTVTITGADLALQSSTPVSTTYTLTVTDVNEPPSAVTLTSAVMAIDENSNTTNPIKLGEIVVADDSLGSVTLSLTGVDAASFEITGGALYLKASVILDYEEKASYAVTINAVDPALPNSPAATYAFTLVVNNLTEAGPAIEISQATVSENLPIGTVIGTLSQPNQFAGATPLSLFYQPAEGRLILGNTTAAPLAIQMVTVTSPGQKINQNQATLPTAAFSSTNYNANAPFGLHSEIYFANLGSTVITLGPRQTWDFGTVAAIGLTEAQVDANFSTDPDVDFNAGSGAGQFLYSLIVGGASGPITRGDIAYGLSQFTYELVAGAGSTDNAKFTIDGYALKTAQAFDYEAGDRYSIRVRATAPDNTTYEEIITIRIGDVNEAPSAVTLTNPVASLPEGTDTAERIAVAGVVVTDDALGTNALALSGSDAAAFELAGGVLYLKAGVTLDHEIKASYSVVVSAADATVAGSSPATVTYTLSVADVNEAPTAVALANAVATLPESPVTSTATRIKVADIAISDDAIGTNSITVSGQDAAAFEADATGLYLKAGVALDFETKDSYAVTVSVIDSTVAGSTAVTAAYSLTLTNVNESPTAVTLATVLGSLAESASTASRIKVAEVTVADDALGTNVLSLAGADAALFELDGMSLYLKAGTSLDYGLKSAYDVTVRVVDTTAVDRLAETPLTVFYEPATGRLRLVNTTAGELAIQSSGIVSPTQVLAGAAATLPNATVTTSNTDPQGVFGQGSEIFFANFGTAALTLAAGATWEFGPVMATGLSASAIASAFATDADADPQNTAATSRFLYSLIVSGAGGPTTRGAIIRDVTAGFSLAIANVPEYSGREYVEIAVGQELVATNPRSDARQIIVRGAGRVILDAANTHTGGVLVEAGELVVRNASAIGSGRLEVRPGARVTLDTGTSRVTVPQLVMPTGGILEVGRGGLSIAAGGYSATELRQRLQAGRNGGQWNGAGIRSVNAASGSFRAVGYRVLADGSAVVGWAGFGDTNLDGRVNSSDISMILASGRFGTSANDGGWWQGDFNYDGRVNSQDLNLMLAAGLINAGSYLPAAGGGSGTSLWTTGVSPASTASWAAGLFAVATRPSSERGNLTSQAALVEQPSPVASSEAIPVLARSTESLAGHGSGAVQELPTVKQTTPQGMTSSVVSTSTEGLFAAAAGPSSESRNSTSQAALAEQPSLFASSEAIPVLAKSTESLAGHGPGAVQELPTVQQTPPQEMTPSVVGTSTAGLDTLVWAAIGQRGEQGISGGSNRKKMAFGTLSQ